MYCLNWSDSYGPIFFLPGDSKFQGTAGSPEDQEDMFLLPDSILLNCLKVWVLIVSPGGRPRMILCMKINKHLLAPETLF